MPATPPPEPQLRIFDATMRAVMGPAEQPAPYRSPDEVGIPALRPAPDDIEPRLASEEITTAEEVTVEMPRFDELQLATPQPADPALFLLSRGRHRMW